MNPALSVIAFTTFSGAGYGLLALLGLLGAVGLLPADKTFGLVGLGLALTFVTGGLLSSTIHLKHPERAWRGLSQWRSSWLSREAVLAIITYGPALYLAYGWIVKESLEGVIGMAGLLTALLALATVSSTAMIYASLTAIQRWAHPYVLPIYLGFSIQLGSLWLLALTHTTGTPSSSVMTFAFLTTILVWGMKTVYWRDIDNETAGSTVQSATGLQGEITPFDPPHTEENFLLHEMGYKIARKHAAKLRKIALVGGAGAPLLLFALSAVLPSELGFALITLCVAMIATAGALLERWLFFAEAKHTSQIYYEG